MKKKLILSVFIIAFIAGTAMKLINNKETVQENIYREDADKKILIQADTASLSSLNRTYKYTGTFIPFREVMILPQVHGEVTGVYFKEGDVVAQGKKLIQVDDELLQAQYASVEANYQTAKRNLSRYENASEGGGVSQLQVDNYRLNLKSAESQLKQLAKQIRLSSIEAPFTGTITYKEVEKGSVIGNSPVARVTDLSKLKLEISVPEKEIGLFEEGEFIEVITDVFPGKAFKGQIEYVANRADDAHNYDVKILIDNNKGAQLLKAGMYGTAYLNKQGNTQAITIPRSALLGSAKNPQVFVIEQGLATLKSIQTGASDGESVEVTQGLTAGDVVITSGHINLVHGSKVTIASH